MLAFDGYDKAIKPIPKKIVPTVVGINRLVAKESCCCVAKVEKDVDDIVSVWSLETNTLSGLRILKWCETIRTSICDIIMERSVRANVFITAKYLPYINGTTVV